MDNNPAFNKKNSFVCKKGMREIWIRKKISLFSLSFISIDQTFYFMEEKQMEEKQKDLVHIHEALNFWAELDLNQRRHIVNEFTVRPH